MFSTLSFIFFTENGWRSIRFHVDGNLHHFSTDDETKIRETVANIFDCSIEEVQVHGYLRSTSFFVVLAIKEIYSERLLAMTQHDKDKLRKLKIDYIQDGSKTIKLQQTTGYKVLFFSVNKIEIEKRVVLCMLQYFFAN